MFVYTYSIYIFIHEYIYREGKLLKSQLSQFVSVFQPLSDESCEYHNICKKHFLLFTLRHVIFIMIFLYNSHFTLFNNIFALLSTKWNGQIIVTDEFNINSFSESENYSENLKKHDLIQLLEKPTSSGTNLIYHISSNLTKANSQNVQLCDEIIDHDVPYVIANIQWRRFEQRYKCMCDGKL